MYLSLLYEIENLAEIESNLISTMAIIGQSETTTQFKKSLWSQR